jgi:diadenosine tetraphosphatase ApaH/serine/threonine PP2A family protein phosphatase
MKYAIFGDVHANLEALERMLELCDEMGVDEYYCIGDIVGYAANPGECVERIRALPLAGMVKGNHDHQASIEDGLERFNPAAREAMEWTRRNLSEDQRTWLRQLPMMKQFGKITLVHASLTKPEKWQYVFDEEAADKNFRFQFSQICFCGHSHVPLYFDKFGTTTGGRYEEIEVAMGHKYLINVGSVGQPRDGDWRLSFCTYDTDEKIIRNHRAPYDIRVTQEKIIEAGLPQKCADRLMKGK